VAVSGVGDGSLQPPDRRLGTRRPPARRSSSSTRSRWPSSAADPTPAWSVRVADLHAPLPQRRDRRVDGLQRPLLRQRRARELSVWARALGIGGTPSAAATISKSWSWLDEQGLVTTAPRGRLREIRFLREDGSRRPYQHPGGDESARGDYFKLPYAYWEAHYPGRLGLPAKALLLIALSLGQDFWLPHDRGARWYGLSRDTVARGLATLLRLGLLEVRAERKKAPLSPRGFTEERRYALRPPFGTGFASGSSAGASVAASRRRARARALTDGRGR
jgi:hypothetical protein